MTSSKMSSENMYNSPKQTSKVIKIFLLLLLSALVAAPFTYLKPKQLTLVDTGTRNDESLKEKQVITPAKKVIEQPLHQVDLPIFSAIRDVKQKKKQFFDFIRPSVERKNHELLAIRATLSTWLEKISLDLSLNEAELVQLHLLVKRYRVSKKASVLQQVNELLVRVDIIPVSLVLVQAANESAWGTSRFSRIGLNFFGIWCYRQGCGMVPSGRNNGAKHEVEAFQSVDASIARYFNNINSHNAYQVFRTIRFELRAQNQPLNAEVLATGLLAYSERGADYVVDITAMLRHNKKYLGDNVVSTTVISAD